MDKLTKDMISGKLVLKEEYKELDPKLRNLFAEFSGFYDDWKKRYFSRIDSLIKDIEKEVRTIPGFISVETSENYNKSTPFKGYVSSKQLTMKGEFNIFVFFSEKPDRPNPPSINKQSSFSVKDISELSKMSFTHDKAPHPPKNATHFYAYMIFDSAHLLGIDKDPEA